MKRCPKCKVMVNKTCRYCPNCNSSMEGIDLSTATAKARITTEEVTKAFNDMKKEPRLAVSESFMIGIDIATNGDMACLTVSKCMGSKLTVVNTLYGDEALEMYHKLYGQTLVPKKQYEETLGADWEDLITYSLVGRTIGDAIGYIAHYESFQSETIYITTSEYLNIVEIWDKKLKRQLINSLKEAMHKC